MMMRIVACRESGLGTLPEHRLVASSCFCLQLLLLLLWDVTHYFVGYVEAGRRATNEVELIFQSE